MSSPLRILLVEDSEDDAALIARQLRGAGYEPRIERVASADGLEAALDRGPWDLIVSDYNIPGFSGPRALEIVSGRKVDAPFILVSGSVGEDIAVKAMKSGANDYVLKSNLARLAPAVSRELREAESRRQRRLAEEALRFFAHATVTLASSLDLAETLRAIAKSAVPFLADWCIVDATDGGPGRAVTTEVYHVDPAKLAVLERLRGTRALDVDPTSLLGVVLFGAGARVLETVTEPEVASVAGSDERRRTLEAVCVGSWMGVPLALRGKVLGAMSLGVTTPGRAYGSTHLSMAEELARRAATAVENAHLYRSAQDAIRAREEFLTVAAHEFRTPLTSARLQAQAVNRALQRELAPADAARFVTKMATLEQQLARMSTLVDRLLDVTVVAARRLPLDLVDVDLCRVASDVAQAFQPTMAQASCSLQLDLCDSCIGRWDRMRLEQVITNLLSNAVKYGPNKPVELRVECRGAEAAITVRDHGIGIATEDQQRIFERFERAVSTRHYGGFGVGLWLARIIVEALLGTIYVESTVGEGSSFTVRLPRSRPDGSST